MDKLYDLMLMGLKYQTLCIRKPADILKVGFWVWEGPSR